VDVLQQRGPIVGLTGDGMNDVLAPKKADCGIAVSGMTEAARSAASIVLPPPAVPLVLKS
jgi:H+-transporting ATPase